MCDFETTVYAEQSRTDVWAAAMCELYTEDCEVFHSVEEWFRYCRSLSGNICCYFHNLKFDGSFILDYLMNVLEYKQAYDIVGGGDVIDGKKYQEIVKFRKMKDMNNKTFRYTISDMGMWYSITIKVDGRIIEIRDSLKLLPFSVREIGRSFGTKHRKLDMEYEGFRYPGCEITPEEQEYIKNDVYVVKEALEIMFNEGHNHLTIGSGCLEEYKGIIGKKSYAEMFPDVYKTEIDEDQFGCDNAGTYIHRSYKGGWCYLAEGKENKHYHNGVTVDVNSLYPSVMHSDSGSLYPVGEPHFWIGDIPEEAKGPLRYYFVRFRTRFRIKPGYLPFIQIKGNLLYSPNECLKTSDVQDPKTGEYHRFYKGFDGEKVESFVTLTMTMTDYELFLEHYNVKGMQILDGCWFEAKRGIFDEYIEKYKQIKMNSKGARRQIAKLFLNNLYGKMASSTISSFKKAYVGPDGSIGFETIIEHAKKPGYIPVGSAITSYARNFTIRAAQKNYHGVDKPGFIYADTDSLHIDLPIDQVVGVPLHDTEFNHWKCESCWDDALFVRQKTYTEHVTHEDLKPVERPYYIIKCAGMPERCKTLLLSSILQIPPSEIKPDDITYTHLSKEEEDFIKVKRTISDFKIGLVVPGKLLPKRIPGGTLLINTSYEMR